jgi:hypothetical protein
MGKRGKPISLAEFLASSTSSSSSPSSSSGSSGSGPSSTLLGLLAQQYGSIPGPTRATLDKAAEISLLLRDKWNVDTSKAGIVGVAQTAGSAFHVAFSPDLQTAVTVRKVSLVGVTMHTAVAQEIVENVTFNKGCAEKKLMSAAVTSGLTFTSYAVVEYPLRSDPKLLASHMNVGSSSGGSFYGPCDSCKGVYGKVMALKKM